ncbi:MAG TPA: AraC family transcriptional regulator [Rhizomicrobium sp.]|jgi:AraC-like DNA-binding protein
MAEFEKIPHGLQRIGARQSHSRHRHAGAYAAIVLHGRYEEWGSRGRWRVEAGDVLFHDAFESHGDRFGKSDCAIFNLPLPPGFSTDIVQARCHAIDAVMEAGEDAVEMLLRHLEPRAAIETDWPDRLVADLARDPDLRLSDWAARHALSPEALSRGLRRVYGVTPAALRCELRAYRAWTMLSRTRQPMAAIALDAGFADQSHMTRAVSRLTGRPPSHWRRNWFVRP